MRPYGFRKQLWPASWYLQWCIILDKQRVTVRRCTGNATQSQPCCHIENKKGTRSIVGPILYPMSLGERNSMHTLGTGGISLNLCRNEELHAVIQSTENTIKAALTLELFLWHLSSFILQQLGNNVESTAGKNAVVFHFLLRFILFCPKTDNVAQFTSF